MTLYELSSTDETEEVPSKKPENWKSKCSEILMQSACKFCRVECHLLNATRKAASACKLHISYGIK